MINILAVRSLASHVYVQLQENPDYVDLDGCPAVQSLCLGLDRHFSASQGIRARNYPALFSEQQRLQSLFGYQISDELQKGPRSPCSGDASTIGFAGLAFTFDHRTVEKVAAVSLSL